MATFDTDQKNQIAVSIGITPTLFAAHLVAFGVSLTDDIKTKVLAELTRYGTPGSVARQYWITATESNRGVSTTKPATGSDNSDPRANIRLLLEIPYDYWPSNAGYGSIPIFL